jgi:hypothetical protein
VAGKWQTLPVPAGPQGPRGHDSRIRVTAEPAGANCKLGGQKIETGLDANDNGVLDPSEVESTVYVCSGPCIPSTCGSLGKLTGTWPSGCGGTLECHPRPECNYCGYDTCGIDANCDDVLTHQPDLDTDVLNCGACGNNCAGNLAHVRSTCVAGSCATRCEDGYWDLNGDRSCEYPCTLTSAQEVCNSIDDNCDGRIDESCVSEGSAPCPSGISPEVCDGIDNDCDGYVDEGLTATPCTGANPAGLVYNAQSQCKMGMTACRNGATRCVGELGPSRELCDGVDNDCDGSVDEGALGTGETCRGPLCGGTPGVVACANGTFVCQGGTTP